MILSKTPYRVSFFGGGTDYHTWYEKHGGEVLSAAINHHCYISCRYMPPFNEEYKYRIVWKILEYVNDINDIKHPAIKGVLNHYNLGGKDLEITTQSDLPARSGLGSSSSFTTGLIKALKAMQGKMISKEDLAKEAVFIEREVLKENVGIQDQIAAAFGGLNHIKINKDGSFNVEPVIISKTRKFELKNHFLLFFTGISRDASDVASEQVKTSAEKKEAELHKMQSMVKDAIEILSDETKDLRDFGKMLDISWQLKRSLTSKISNNLIDEIYDKGLKSGAYGGKLLGAGGGGFMLFFAEPAKHEAIKESLKDLIFVPFDFDNEGSSIILYNPKNYSDNAYNRRDYVHFKHNGLKLG